MKAFLPVLLAFVAAALTGCATTHSPKLDISMSIDKQNANLVFVKVKLVNTEDHATVPVAVQVTGQAKTNGHWDKTSTLIQPAAFVLNKKEQREITKLWRVPAEAARVTLTVKEQERGILLKTERQEKVFSAGSSSTGAPPPPAAAAPAKTTP